MNYLVKNTAIAATVLLKADQVLHHNCHSVKKLKNIVDDEEHERYIQLHSMWGKGGDISS